MKQGLHRKSYDAFELNPSNYSFEHVQLPYSKKRVSGTSSILGMMRRIMMGRYYAWKGGQKSQRQSTLKDFYDAMNRFNHRLAFATITARSR